MTSKGFTPEKLLNDNHLKIQVVSQTQISKYINITKEELQEILKILNKMGGGSLDNPKTEDGWFFRDLKKGLEEASHMIKNNEILPGARLTQQTRVKFEVGQKVRLLENWFPPYDNADPFVYAKEVGVITRLALPLEGRYYVKFEDGPFGACREILVNRGDLEVVNDDTKRYD